MLVSAYHILQRGIAHAELGARHFDRLRTARQIRSRIRPRRPPASYAGSPQDSRCSGRYL